MDGAQIYSLKTEHGFYFKFTSQNICIIALQKGKALKLLERRICMKKAAIIVSIVGAAAILVTSIIGIVSFARNK